MLDAEAGQFPPVPPGEKVEHSGGFPPEIVVCPHRHMGRKGQDGEKTRMGRSLENAGGENDGDKESLSKAPAKTRDTVSQFFSQTPKNRRNGFHRSPFPIDALLSFFVDRPPPASGFPATIP
jgi:hypothetical protein